MLTGPRAATDAAGMAPVASFNAREGFSGPMDAMGAPEEATGPALTGAAGRVAR